MARSAGRSGRGPGSGAGTYALLLRARRRGGVRVGRLGTLALEPGLYLYVGSAFGPGGVRGRVARHLRGDGRRHWHVDHLRGVTEPEEVWYSHEGAPREHAWAALLRRSRGAREPLRGFGASDCTCATHLFHFPRRPSLAGFRRRLRARLPHHARVDSLRVAERRPR